MQGFPLQGFMQGLQPAQVVFAGNPFMPVAPQYPAVAPIQPQAPPLAQFPGPADQPWFQALVAAVSKAVIKDIEKLNGPAAAPEELSPENEKILIDVLKKGKEDKLPMDRIFQELCKKHGYTENVWMKWFATNIDKLYPKLTLPKANVEQAPGRDEAGGSSRPRSQAAAPPRSVPSNNRPTTTFRFVQEQPHPRSRKVVTEAPKPPAGSTQAKPTATSSASVRPARSSGNGSSLGTTSSAKPPPHNSNRPPVSAPRRAPSPPAPTAYSANRSRRGGSVRVDHDQTLIPWSDGSVKPPVPRFSDGSAKPQLPRRGAVPLAGGTEAGNKLTDAEKIFFVHWLRWRLREGPLPEKETLFEELEEELPHRTAETWKRHWSNHCAVPDALYINARKRVDAEREQDPSRGESPLTPPPPGAEPSDAASGESEIESDGSSDDEPSEDSTYNSGPAPRRRKQLAAMAPPRNMNMNTKAKTKVKTGGMGPSRPLGGVPVTDEDLRAMAQYRFARGGEWEDQSVPHKTFWHGFAHRPENNKRSWDGWNSAARDPKHFVVIERYVKELERRASASVHAAMPSSNSKPAPCPGLPAAASRNAPSPQQNRPVPPPPPSSSSSSGNAGARQLGDTKAATAMPQAASPRVPQKRAGEVVDDVGGNWKGAGNRNLKEVPPPLKRKRPSWPRDVHPADIVDLTGDD